MANAQLNHWTDKRVVSTRQIALDPRNCPGQATHLLDPEGAVGDLGDDASSPFSAILGKL